MQTRNYPGGKRDVKTKYVSGVLNFYDLSGNVIYQLDPVNRAITVPSGAALTINAGLGSAIKLTNLPTADPSVAGALYNSSGTVKVSAG